jgi:hypothetical protein
VLKKQIFISALAALVLSLHTTASYSQVSVDIDAETARRAVGTMFLEDLSVNDNAYIYSNLCVKDNGLYITGWTVPANHSKDTYTDSGVTLQIRVLSGRRLAVWFVDARQVQLKAQGNPSAGAVLSKEEYDKAVRRDIERIFSGDLFHTPMCDDELRSNPLRKTDLFAVDTLNGYKKLSDVLRSVSTSPSKQLLFQRVGFDRTVEDQQDALAVLP